MQTKLAKTIAYYAAAFFQGLCLVSFPAASMILKSPEANALSDGQYGLAFVAQIAAAIAATVWVPKLLRRFSEKQIFLSGLTSNLLCLATLWVTLHTHSKPDETFWLVFGANAFLGAGFGLTISVMNLCVVELHPHHKDAALAGLHGLLGTGGALAPLSVNYFHEQGGWTNSLFPGFVLGAALILSTVFFKFVSSSLPSEEAAAGGAKAEPLSGAILAFLGALIIYGAVESMLGNWTVTFVHRDKMLSAHAASVSLSLFWIFLTIGRLMTSALSMKIRSEWIYCAAPLMMAVSLAALHFSRTQEAVWVSYLFIGLGCSSIFPLTLSLAIARFPAHKEMLSSLTLTALMMGVGLGSSGVAFLQAQNIADLPQLFLGSVFLSALLFPVFVLFARIPPVLKDY